MDRSDIKCTARGLGEVDASTLGTNSGRATHPPVAHSSHSWIPSSFPSLSLSSSAPPPPARFSPSSSQLLYPRRLAPLSLLLLPLLTLSTPPHPHPRLFPAYKTTISPSSNPTVVGLQLAPLPRRRRDQPRDGTAPPTPFTRRHHRRPSASPPRARLSPPHTTPRFSASPHRSRPLPQLAPEHRSLAQNLSRSVPPTPLSPIAPWAAAPRLVVTR